MSDYKEVPFPFPKGPIKPNRKYHLSFFIINLLGFLAFVNFLRLQELTFTTSILTAVIFLFLNLSLTYHLFSYLLLHKANYKRHKELEPWIKNNFIKDYLIKVNKENRLLTIYEVKKLIQYGKDVDCFLAYQTISELSD